ncbi:Prolyl tripeptidyl peptidase precursor [Salinivirga cyanobacteriivorans]|uniref:Prolyl tripeptidyl peptidase n=1 Tax=Salinivirga cyanobacteriivorans TaxID=1307839 RepID=A0A0S2HXH9_9BACT|nr:DPP IV N-terminal domain-containing protein [Salinivirga cyanobacteriivorans]ALO14751.1 Prolyl tripeptidyl peptidase precursor [Salinivirga cyanobacteriivorans]
MKNLVLIFAVFVVALANPSWAQDDKFTMEDAVIGQWRGLYPRSIYGYWQPQTHILTYSQENKIIRFDADTKQKDTLLTLKNINAALKAAEADSLKRLSSPDWIDNERLLFRNKNKFYVYSTVDNSIKKTFTFQPTDNNFDYPDELSKNMIAVTNGNSLFIIKPNARITVAQSRDKDIVYGQSVSRREFGISKGTFWSPKANYLAYYIKDNSDVTDYPLVDITSRTAEAEMTLYPMAGTPSEHVSLGIYNVDKNQTIYIEDENAESEQYLTNISWGPNEEYIYIQVLNREQNHMKFNKYDVKTGAFVKTLFEEKHEKYVEPYHKIHFVPGDDDKFVYQTRRDGYNHLYLYTTDGKEKGQITSGNWEVTQFLGFGPKGRYAYYVSTEGSPLERHAYKINIKNSQKKTKITQSRGYHRVKLSSDANYLYDRYSSTDVPGISQVINTNTLEKYTLKKAKNPLKPYALGEMEIGTIKAGDDKTDLYYRLIKPTDFDSTKTYPAIVYVYGGPHAQLISNRWMGGARMWQQYMAQNGYVMLTIDNRGSANRGLDFENATHRQLGKLEMKDQLRGIEFLKQLGYVDTTKLGVHGWSYGGFMTTSLMTHHPEVFQVGVAGGPVIDWKYYEIMYGERYMDTPDENPEGYKSTSLIDMAPELKGKLLIIHGGMDPTVVQQHSLAFLRACIKNNIPVDYFVYPQAEHNVRGKDRIHLMQKVTDYFNDYLK